MEQPDIRPISDKLYILAQDYSYEYMVNQTKLRINAFKNYIYDGASVPRIVWTISGLTPDGLIRAAALIHDLLYDYKGILPKGQLQRFDKTTVESDQWVDIQYKFSRKEADKMFARIMREAGIERKYRRRAYLAVRTFGKLYWNS